MKKIAVTLIFSIAILQLESYAQIDLVKDINTVKTGTNPVNLVAVNSTLYFVATSKDGIGLWKTSGTGISTKLVKEINPSNLTDVNGTLYFTASDEANGMELWKSDGTEEGTVLVRDIFTGTSGSNPSFLINVNGLLYFIADSPNNGRELWKSDGTAGGTIMVKDIFTSGSSDINSLVNVNGLLFFTAINNSNGRELWRSDGSSLGTVMVKDIVSGSAGSNPNNLININGTLYFRASDSVSGQELWKSDGTSSGTIQVKDIWAGTSSGISSADPSFTNLNGVLYFAANNGTSGIELWKSDGSSAGTVLVKDIFSGSNSCNCSSIKVVNGALMFSATNGVNGKELWKSDGTQIGTIMIKDIFSGTSNSDIINIIDINGIAFFSANDGINGQELWKSDGSSAGTVLVKNISAIGGSDINFFTKANGTLFFAATNSNGRELWKSYGTEETTLVVKDIENQTSSSIPQSVLSANGFLFFSADNGINGRELWKSDGKSTSTTMIKDIFPGSSSSNATGMISYKGAVYFTANDGVSGAEFWKSDGTSAGTMLVKDIRLGSSSSGPGSYVLVNDLLYFIASDGPTGGELWKSDGTAAGTTLVKDIVVGSGSSNPSWMTNVNGVLYFTATNGTNGVELWKSDGTASGTVMVKDIKSGSASSNPTKLTAVNNTLYFAAQEIASGTELWKSDGTLNGTVLVKDIVPGAQGCNPSSLTDVNGTLFLSVSPSIGIWELWKSDGTVAGTILVKAVTPNVLSYSNGLLFFSANNGTLGTELWKSDGTEGGTVLVKDINPGTSNSYPGNFVSYSNSLYFIADGGTGASIWKTDGTSCGTIPLADSDLALTVSQFSLVGKQLLSVALHSHFGQELFKYNIEADSKDPCQINSPPQSISTKALFNGLITSMRWRTDAAYSTDQNEFTGMYSFQYDDKYQLKESNWANPLNLSVTTNKYRVAGLTYDPNGNILSLKRFSQSGGLTNNFVYKYEEDSNTQLTNQLQSITGYSNYKYNKIGQLEADEKVDDDDQYITYDVSGKVRFVYSDLAKQNPKVEFIYDDRGFRMAKKNYVSNRTTWYIRDVSGNVLSSYEEDHVANSFNQTEVPIYGAGKLGTYYPGQDGSSIYEITDHLGNVRALVRDNVNVYTATMEDNDQTDISNPRVEEMQYFLNLFETEKEDSRMNHSAPVPGVDVPNKSSYLFWQSGVAGNDALDKSVGPGMMLKVSPGDNLEMEVWARFENKITFARNFDLLLLSQFLGGNFYNIGGFEGYTASQAATTFQNALQGAGFMNDGSDTERPFAYLNYIVFDANMQAVSGQAQRVRVPETAGFDPGQEGLPNMHQKLSLDAPVNISEFGYIYIWVSNESENTKVWFDDLKVTHEGSFVNQATDYGPWGDVIREQKTDESVYRHGYQGKFSEKDVETGWNHFEAREYDAVIGRWLVPDPANQHSSPYLAFSNNPINRIDPDGRWDFGEKIKNWFRFGEFLTNAQFDAKYYERINVLIWDKTAGKDVGHTAVEIDGLVFGYYPTDENRDDTYSIGELLFSTGELHINSKTDFELLYSGQTVTSYSIKVTPAQKATLLGKLGDVSLKPGNYSLIARQCTSIVMNCMGDSGIKINDVGGDLNRLHIGVAPKAFEATLTNIYNSFLVESSKTFIVGKP